MADSSPTFTAELLGIKPLTLRRWCEYHAAHLSAGTNPPSGQARRFTDKDIEVLKHIKHLRSQGFSTIIINAQLVELTFPEVIIDERSEDSTELASGMARPLPALVDAPDNAGATQALMVAVSTLQTQMEAIQTARRAGWERDALLVAMGILIGVIIFLGVLVTVTFGGGG